MLLQKLYIGLNDKDKNVQLITTQKAIFDIRSVCDEFHIDSLTILQATGYYKYEQEKSLIVEYMCEGRAHLIPKECIETIRDRLNQQCIIVSVQEIEINFA